MCHKFLQHHPAKPIIDAGHQLPIGEGPGSAFTKLNVRAFIQPLLLPKGLYICHALLHRRSLLQDDRLIPGSCQHQTTEHPRRPQSNNHWAVLHRLHPRPELRFVFHQQAILRVFP